MSADIVEWTKEERPMRVAAAEQLNGSTKGPITVADGGVLVISGEHDGPIEVAGGGQLDVRGVVRGPITIESLGRVTVRGDVVGPVLIRVAGTLAIEAAGRVSGNVTNFGSFTNHGLRAGRVDGRTPDDREESTYIVDEPAYELPARS
jgi:hypothetical protein